MFAAELVLPYRLFKPLEDEAAIEMDIIEELAGRFLTSVTATGSRFAVGESPGGCNARWT